MEQKLMILILMLTLIGVSSCTRFSMYRRSAVSKDLSYSEYKTLVAEAENLIEGAVLDHENGDFALALEKNKAGLRISKIIEHKGLEARALTGMGAFHLAAGNHPEALTHYQDAKAIVLNTIGPDDPSLIHILSTIGKLWAALEDYPQALAVQKQAFHMAVKEYGREDIAVAVILIEMAKSAYLVEGCDEALLYCEESLAIYSKETDVENPDLEEMERCVEECGKASGEFEPEPVLELPQILPPVEPLPPAEPLPSADPSEDSPTQ